MRKKLALLTMAFAFNVLPAGDALAKPSYCYDVYLWCIEECSVGFPLWDMGCRIGCSIGYWQC